MASGLATTLTSRFRRLPLAQGDRFPSPIAIEAALSSRLFLLAKDHAPVGNAGLVRRHSDPDVMIGCAQYNVAAAVVRVEPPLHYLRGVPLTDRVILRDF